eukprot:Lithocolla_globosa_v1_NODE_4823_length_1358_cov_9.949348.p1 type:complete len:404 gc:universal NODE_4823_length_1358_cov_9.949348:1307-96(-)
MSDANTVDVEKLTDEHKQIFSKWKESISDVLKEQPPERQEDAYLLRWMWARSFDPVKAEQMFRESMLWRKEVGADTILETYTPHPLLLKYYPTGIFRYSKEGFPCMWVRHGMADLIGLEASVGHAEILKYLVWFNEKNDKFIEGRRKEGNPSKWVVVVDLKMDKINVMESKFLKLFGEISNIGQANYPERMESTYFINVPAKRLVQWAVSLMKWIFDAHMLAKWNFIFDQDPIEELSKVIPKEDIPQFSGGLACDPDPDCSAYIPLGGLVPKEHYMKNSSRFESVTISRSSKHVINLDVPGEVKLSYEFITGDHDIAFGVFFESTEKKERKVVHESKRILAKTDAHKGELSFEEMGVAYLEFDNTYSYMRAKTVLVNYELLPMNTQPSEKEASGLVRISTMDR